MPWIAAGIGAGGSLLGGLIGSDASSDAARAQSRSAADNLAFQRWLYEQNLRRSEPYSVTGQGALSQLAQMFGLPSMPYQAPNLSGGPGGGGQKLGAKDIAKMLKRGMSVDQIAKLGNYVPRYPG